MVRVVQKVWRIFPMAPKVYDVTISKSITFKWEAPDSPLSILSKKISSHISPNYYLLMGMYLSTLITLIDDYFESNQNLVLFLVQSTLKMCKCVFVTEVLRKAESTFHTLNQWFPTGVPRHTGVPWEGARRASNFWIC